MRGTGRTVRDQDRAAGDPADRTTRERCEQAMIRAVLMGPPGAGKGTQAKRLSARAGAVHLSTGDLLRAQVSAGTDLGKEARSFLDQGKLVPDRVVLGMVETELTGEAGRRGFVLDGFPRTTGQSEGLDELLNRVGQPLDAVLILDVPEEEIVRRLAGRRTCPQCGAIYPSEGRPAALGDDRCDQCQSPLTIRPDDRPDVIRERLRVYRQQTAPVVAHYELEGLARHVKGLGEVDEIAQRLEEALETMVPPGTWEPIR